MHCSKPKSRLMFSGHVTTCKRSHCGRLNRKPRGQVGLIKNREYRDELAWVRDDDKSDREIKK